MSDPVPSSAIYDATTGGLSVIVITGGSTGQVLTLQANGTYAPATVSAGIGGSVGSTDNRLVRSDGTGGSTVQSTGITVNDSQDMSGIHDINMITGGLIIGTESRISLSSGAGGQLAGYISTTPIFSASTSGGFRLQNTVAFGFANVAGGIDNAADVKWSRGSTGPTFDVCCAGGIRSRNLAGSADAPISGEAITATGLICCGVYTFSTVPSASSNTGKFLRISDRAQKHAYSDGTNWRFFGDDAVIS
jgi:hypothetical protein